MKLQLNTSMVPIFTGTYQDWEPIETDDHGEEVEIDYKHDDLMKSIVEAYQNKTPDILETLKGYGIDFIDSIKFTGGYYCPREYNFETDSLDLEIEIINGKLLDTLVSLESDKAFHKFLDENYSDRDGFISYTPNTTKEIKDAIINRTDQLDQSVSAIINYFLVGKDVTQSIEAEVQEYWQSNGYLSLDYKLIREA
jgi:hypothetical protein